jgi:hypothetical protein
MREPTRQVPENALGLLGGRTVPSLTQHLLDPGVQRRVEPLDDIASLAHLAALNQREATKGVAHGPARHTDQHLVERPTDRGQRRPKQACEKWTLTFSVTVHS